ncbi:MAG: hypothetical protein KC643_05870, partial [Nitrospira sp.]|nr:hypothetical protein [Nitrospira sp.]
DEDHFSPLTGSYVHLTLKRTWCPRSYSRRKNGPLGIFQKRHAQQMIPNRKKSGEAFRLPRLTTSLDREGLILQR